MTEGKITLDGLDIREVAQHDLREKLGYVPQKGVLFSGTIASNIMFGNPDGSDEEMKEAAQIAQATEFIETKRKRYDSSIAQADPTYPADRNNDFPLRVRSQNIRNSLSSTTVFRHWILRPMLHCVGH